MSTLPALARTPNPERFFRAGQAGVFLDMNTPYRYKDAAGTTLATADTNPLGLIYDLKNGVPVLGASLTLLATTADKIADGTTTVNVLATSGIVGKAVRVQFTVASITGSFTVSSTGTSGTSVTISSTGVYDIVVMAGATGGSINFEGLTTSRFSVTGIVIKELPGSHAYQATTTARPLLGIVPTYYYAKFDLADDVLNTYLPAITNGTICLLTSKGAWFDTLTVSAGVFSIGPTTYTSGPKGLLTALKNGAADFRLISCVIIDQALSSAEKSALVSWGRSRGCPGEITLGSELFVDPSFDNAGSWTLGAGWSITGGNAVKASSTSLTAVGQLVGTLSTASTYIITSSSSAISGNFGFILGGAPAIGDRFGQFSSTGVNRYVGTPNAFSTTCGFGANSGTTSATMSSCSLKEVIFP